MSDVSGESVMITDKYVSYSRMDILNRGRADLFGLRLANGPWSCEGYIISI